MKSTIAMFVVVLATMGTLCLAADLTRTREASGKFVVDTVIRQIEASSVFPSDYSFLRRVAFVESKDGEDPNTFRANYFGGIFQVDSIGFDATKDTASHPGLVSKHAAILTKFGIDWSAVTWEDCTEPMISALAARLHISNVPNPIPTTVAGQAAYWKDHYNSASGAGTVQKFIDAVAAFEAANACSADSTMMIVLDSSGSIGSSDYALARTFVSDLIPRLNVGPAKSSVGFIHYSNTPTLYMNFTNDGTAAQAAIAAIPYTSGGTKTGLAINLATNAFVDAAAFDDSKADIEIVLTDGQSGDDVIPPAQNAKERGVTTISVGIGSGVDDVELLEIANGVSANVILSSDYASLDNAAYAIQSAACNAPTALSLGMVVTKTLAANAVAFGSVVVDQMGLSIGVSNIEGSVTTYLSYTFDTPNPALSSYVIQPGMGTVHIPLDTTGLSTRAAATNRTIYIGFVASSNAVNTFSVSTGSTQPSPSPSKSSKVGVAVGVTFGLLFFFCFVAAAVVVALWQVKAKDSSFPDYVKGLAKGNINGPVSPPPSGMGSGATSVAVVESVPIDPASPASPVSISAV